MIGELLHSVVHRPYTFLLFAAYVVIAVRRLGWRRVAVMTPVGYVIAWASECCSINTGFPYGPYRYLDDGLRGELRVAGVPFFDSLSYTFLAYFGWGFAALLLCPMGRDARDGIVLREPLEARRSVRVGLLGTLLMTLLDVAVDPAAARGDRWFLGRIFEYGSPGGWFGVPLSNFGGWLLTGGLIILAYQRIDAWFGPAPKPGRGLRHEAFHPVFLYFCVVAFAVTVSAWIGEPLLAGASLIVHAPLLAWALIRLSQARLVS